MCGGDDFLSSNVPFFFARRLPRRACHEWRRDAAGGYRVTTDSR